MVYEMSSSAEKVDPEKDAAKTVVITIGTYQKWRAAGHAEDPSWLLCEIMQRSAPFWYVRPQPRRYMSMLRCFFEKRECDMSALFHGLAVSRHDEAMRHFQRHPVVAVSFRGISTVSDAERAVRDSFEEHAYLRRHPALSPVDRMIYQQIKRQPLSYGLFEPTRLVQQAHAERAVVLVDHYDEHEQAHEALSPPAHAPPSSTVGPTRAHTHAPTRRSA